MGSVSNYDQTIPKIIKNNPELAIQYPALLKKMSKDTIMNVIAAQPQLAPHFPPEKMKNFTINDIVKIYEKSKDNPDALKYLNDFFGDHIKKLDSRIKNFYKMK